MNAELMSCSQRVLASVIVSLWASLGLPRPDFVGRNALPQKKSQRARDCERGNKLATHRLPFTPLTSPRANDHCFRKCVLASVLQKMYGKCTTPSQNFLLIGTAKSFVGITCGREAVMPRCSWPRLEMHQPLSDGRTHTHVTCRRILIYLVFFWFRLPS